MDLSKAALKRNKEVDSCGREGKSNISIVLELFASDIPYFLLLAEEGE